MQERLSRHLRRDGPDARATVDYRSHFAGALQRVGRFDESCDMRREVHTAFASHLGESDHRTIREGIRLVYILDVAGNTIESTNTITRLLDAAIDADGTNPAIAKMAAELLAAHLEFISETSDSATPSESASDVTPRREGLPSDADTNHADDDPYSGGSDD
jgi:hypothetical protein